MKGVKYEIYIGLKDKDTYEEVLSEETFIKILSEHCTKKRGEYRHNFDC